MVFFLHVILISVFSNKPFVCRKSLFFMNKKKRCYCCSLLSFCLSNPTCYTLPSLLRVCWAHPRCFTLIHFVISHIHTWMLPNATSAKYSTVVVAPQWILWVQASWSCNANFLCPSFCMVSDLGNIRLGQRDASGEWEQRRCSPGQAEEEVPQLVHPQDQQHRAGALRPAERHNRGTGDDLILNILEKSAKAFK